MKKSITKALAVFMSLMLVLMSALPAMAENSSEVEAYLNSTYAKAIDPYGNLKKDDEGRYIIPLSKTSVSLKKDTSSKLYTSSWSSSDDTYAAIPLLQKSLIRHIMKVLRLLLLLLKY